MKLPLKHWLRILRLFETSRFHWFLPLALVWALPVFADSSADVRVTVNEVKDTRTTGKFFAGLEVKLTLIGDSLDGATQYKAAIKEATDDTGRDLIDGDKLGSGFTQLFNARGGQVDCTLSLRNPARRATAIKVLAGELQIHVPKADPEATVRVDELLAKTGKALSNSVLQAAGVEVAIFTPDQAEARKAQQQKETKGSTSRSGLAGMLDKAFAELLGGIMRVGENDVVVTLNDPQSRVVALEFVDGAGKVIRPRSWQSSQGTRVYSFNQKLAPDTGLRILLASPKSLLRVPVRLADIVLP